MLTGAFSQEKNEVVFPLRIGEEELFLQFSADPAFPRLLLREELSRARKNSVDLFPALGERTIAAVRIASDDRVLRVAFTDASALLCILFSTKANALLLGSDGSVLDSFKKKTFVPPPPPSWENAITLPQREEIAAVLRAGAGLPLERALRSIRPYLQGTLATELLHRCALERDRACDALSGEDASRLATELSALLEEAAAGTPHLYGEDGVPAVFSLVRLTHTDASELAAELPLLEALAFFVRKRQAADNIDLVRNRALAAVKRETDRIERILGKLAPPEQVEARAAEHEKFGNLLMIHANDYPEQPTRMTVPDLFVDPRLVVSIPIEERLTIIENAQRYFDRAKRARASVASVLSRGAYLRTRQSALELFRTRMTSAASRRDLRDIFNDTKDLMASLGLTSKGDTNDAPFPFRRFIVFGGFEVWAGRNSANNDELTVRHAKPNDLWFHARGVGGSHVVLKCAAAAQVPKEAVREAASIAAYYSKHRNAKNVPVAYTEKKYVHKPKGVPAGTVYLDREKVIMAEPRLPEGATEEKE